MASGGWLSGLLGSPLKLINNLFNAGSKNVSTSIYPTETAQDLVPSTESAEPESPEMGDADNTSSKTKKKKGISSLYVTSNSSNNSSTENYTGRSDL